MPAARGNGLGRRTGEQAVFDEKTVGGDERDGLSGVFVEEAVRLSGGECGIEPETGYNAGVDALRVAIVET
jgi:hypothetical protein